MPSTAEVVLVVIHSKRGLERGQQPEERDAGQTDEARGPPLEAKYGRSEERVCVAPPLGERLQRGLAVHAVRGVLCPSIKEDGARVDGRRQGSWHVRKRHDPLAQRRDAAVRRRRHVVACHGVASAFAHALLLVVQEGEVAVQEAIRAQVQHPDGQEPNETTDERLLGRWLGL